VIIPKRFSEALGLWAGSVVSPIFAIGSFLRQGRVVHDRGISFRAEVKPAEGVDEAYAELADSLSQGDTLVRFSPGKWRSERGLLPDVLGVAIRFGADENNDFAAQDRSQDLLMITAKRLAMLPLAMLATNQRDFLDNNYYGGAPFEIAGRPDLRLRLVPQIPANVQGPDRFTKLRNAVAEGDVKFLLEIVSPRDESLSSPLVEIQLVEEVAVDDDKLAMFPFQDGQNIRPQGFIQFTRPVPYMLSQYARNM
jgi:hypothetical protein